MSYNVDTFKVKVLEGLQLPIKSLYKHGRADWHPSEPELLNGETGLVRLQCGCEQTISGILKDGILFVTEIDMSGEGSGTFISWILEPALKESSGKLEASCVWEGGDSVNKLIVNDGTIKWEDIEL